MNPSRKASMAFVFSSSENCSDMTLSVDRVPLFIADTLVLTFVIYVLLACVSISAGLDLSLFDGGRFALIYRIGDGSMIPVNPTR